MAVTIGSIQYILKTLWPQDRVKNEVYQDHPFFAMVKKREDFYGENMYLAVRTGDPQGRSASFSSAQTISQISGGAGSQRGSRFLLTRATDYQLVNLGTEAIMAAERDEGALIRSLDTEMKAGINNIGKSAAVTLFRGNSGAIGRIGTITATSITLVNINDVTSFEVGMRLVAAPNTDVTTTVRSTPASADITAVNRDTGVLTFGAGTFTGTNWVNSGGGDFLISIGDAQNAGAAPVKMSGLADWVPATAPTSAAFFGVDRSTDPTRLGGLRVDISSLNPEEGLVTVLSRQAREGGRPSHFFCNHLDYRNIAISLGSKVETEYMSVGTLGFETLKVRGPKGLVAVVADQDCPSGTGYSLDLSTWCVYSLKGMPMILDLDGNQLSRVAAADQFEARICYFAQLGCDAPGFNANVVMPT